MAKFLDLTGLEHFWDGIKAKLDNKVDKVTGKQLSTEDYTTAEKSKLAGVQIITVDAALSSSSANPVQNKAINTALAGKVATSRKVAGKALTADVTITAADVGAIATSAKGTAGGVAELDSTGKVPSAQLPEGVTYNDMKGATASADGTHGLVPAPAAGTQTKYLRGDGTWQTPPNTTYRAATTSTAGLMSAADKTKLDGIVNITNAEIDTILGS